MYLICCVIVIQRMLGPSGLANGAVDILSSQNWFIKSVFSILRDLTVLWSSRYMFFFPLQRGQLKSSYSVRYIIARDVQKGQQCHASEFDRLITI